VREHGPHAYISFPAKCRCAGSSVNRPPPRWREESDPHDQTTLDITLGGALTRRHGLRLLGAMLLLLHGVLSLDPEQPIARALMLAHLGLFLIWQPIWRADATIALRDFAVFVVFTAGLLFALDHWLLSAWLILLTGLVAGTTTGGRHGRLAHLITLAFLLSELLVRAVPAAFELPPLPRTLQALFGSGLVLLPLSLLVLPSDRTAGHPAREVDLLRALNAALVTVVLALGSLIGMYHGGLGYADALVRCLLAIAALLVLTSWVLTPRLGLNSVLGLWERSLLNIGTPFERWLEQVAQLSGRQPSARALLEAGANALGTLPWASGARWMGPGLAGQVGDATAHGIDVHTPDFDMRVYARRRPGPMLRLHAKLLVRVLAHFYRSKADEEALALAARLQAVHETGARVTHDIKNLLQTLQPLAAAVEPGQPVHDPARTLALLGRSLPEIARRLALAVARLEGPAAGSDPRWQPARRWWAQAHSRHAARKVSFSGDVSGEVPLPAELFDNALDNLLDNALRKPALGDETPGQAAVEVQLEATAEGWRLSVSDDGAAVTDELAGLLLLHPVASRSGLGLGLYQCARLASECGYRLQLRENRDGCVRFELAPARTRP
jgi:signal transduction histidine kinase